MKRLGKERFLQLLFGLILIALIIVFLMSSGCLMLSPHQEPGAQQGAVNARTGDILPNARNISPDTTVTAGRDLKAEVSAAVRTELAKATAGRDQDIQAKLIDLGHQIKAQTAQVTSTRTGTGTVGVIAVAVAMYLLGIGSFVVVALVAKWRKTVTGGNGHQLHMN